MAESYNLRMEGKRASHPYDLRKRDHIPVPDDDPGPAFELTYHHVVPYNLLRDFWNALLDNDVMVYDEPFLLGFAEAVGTYSQMVNKRGLATEDMVKVADLSTGIAYNLIAHDPASKRRHEDWDNFCLVYTWFPGNIFVGPTQAQRTDDPGENFENNAKSILGERYDELSRLNNTIRAYAKDGNSKKDKVLAQSASKALRGVTRHIDFVDFNPAQWTRDIGASKAAIRTTG